LIQIHQDLDQTLRIKGTWTGYGATRSRSLYIKDCDPVSLILSLTFSLFSFVPSSLFTNPNPNSFESTQKPNIHGLNALYCCSKHKSVIGRCFQPWNQHEFLSFDGRFELFGFFVFFEFNLRKSTRNHSDSHSL